MDQKDMDPNLSDMSAAKKISTSSTSQSGSTACGKSGCCKKIGVKSKAIACDYCNQWWHMQCAEMDDKTYSVLSQSNSSGKGVFWFCSRCRPNSTLIFETKKIIANETHDIKAQVKQLENSLEAKLKLLEEQFLNKVDTQQNHLNKNMQSITNVVTTKLEQNNKTSSALTTLNNEFRTLKTNIENNIKTEKERNLKKLKANNIILFNMPESEGEKQKAYKDDVEKIKTLFEELKLEKEDVKQIFRIGKTAADRPRPIIVKFNNEEKRKDALKLRNVYYKNNQTQENIKIFITVDRTVNEQIQHKKLVQQLRDMKSQGKENLFIRNGEIVTILPFRPNPQQYWG